MFSGVLMLYILLSARSKKIFENNKSYDWSSSIRSPIKKQIATIPKLFFLLNMFLLIIKLIKNIDINNSGKDNKAEKSGLPLI